jgi:hypothetical protein
MTYCYYGACMGLGEQATTYGMRNIFINPILYVKHALFYLDLDFVLRMSSK